MKKLEQRLRRALFMVPYLATKGSEGVLVSEAAAAIGATPEELRKDVHRLSLVGVPDGDPGQYLTLWIHGSGPHARIGADTICRLKKPPRLTPQEALALLVGAAAVKKTGIAPYDEAIARASKKLRDVLDCNSRSEADRGAHIVVRTAGAEHRDTLNRLSRACSDRRAVDLDYASVAALKRKEIRVHPYGLLNHRGIWYLLGKSLSNKEGCIFPFRAERILGATVLDETFTIPTDFNLRDYMTDRMFITKAKPVEIVSPMPMVPLFRALATDTARQYLARVEAIRAVSTLRRAPSCRPRPRLSTSPPSATPGTSALASSACASGCSTRRRAVWPGRCAR